MAKYRKKTVVDAVQVTKDNAPEVQAFAPRVVLADAIGNVFLWTVLGDVLVRPGDWIVRDVDGEIYTDTDKHFRDCYEEIDDKWCGFAVGSDGAFYSKHGRVEPDG